MPISRVDRLIDEAACGRLAQAERAVEKAGGDPSKVCNMTVYEFLLACVKNNIHTEFVYGGPEEE